MPNLFEHLCDSIFSDICGNLDVKKALVLSLFAGTAKFDKECSDIHIRDHIHVLILGNRCSQKNLFLKCLTTLMKTSCYIVGNCSSVKLMTVRSNNKQKTLEQGALVSLERSKLNYEVCMLNLFSIYLLEFVCIDELEKMNRTQQQIVIQSIEHKKIGVKDYNEFLFYPSNVSIIAAANLITNEFDYSKTIEQNVQITLDLISKFDLVFLIDENSKEYDELVYEKEVKRFCKVTQSESLFDQNILQFFDDESGNFGQTNFLNGNLLSLDIIYKYISHCYKYIHPVIGKNMKNILRDFCLSKISSTVLSKLRIFESLCRLVEAHAKLFMKPEVEENDLVAIVQILQNSLIFIQLQTRKNCSNYIFSLIILIN